MTSAGRSAGDVGRTHAVLMLVTNRDVTSRDVVDVVAEALAAVPPGVAVVQLRDKRAEGAALLVTARALVEICRGRQCALLVNDRVDIALAAGANGAHLPERGFDVATARVVAGDPQPGTAAPGRFVVGRSVHGAAGAGAAAAAGADLIVCGPVWHTPSKAGLGEPLGVDELRRAVDAVAGRAPVYAIGGIDGPERARAARAAGADGIAVIRAVMAAADPGAAAAALYDAMLG